MSASYVFVQTFVKFGVIQFFSVPSFVHNNRAPKPLSAGFIVMSFRYFSWLMACRSVAVRLSGILLGVQVVMSSLTASKMC